MPPADRKLVTNHDAFGYFAAHYGFTVVGSVIPSLSTAASRARSNVADADRPHQGRSTCAPIFTESSLNPAARGADRERGGREGLRHLYGDTLGPAGSPGATYIGMERWNVSQIVAGLLGHRPPAGGC